MAQELMIYIQVGVFGSLLSFFLCLYALFKIKNAPGGMYYILATLMSASFTLFYVFELRSETLDQIKFWLKMEYLALPFIPVFVLLMCFEYVDQKLSRWVYYLIFTLPVITIFLHFTNEFHHLYYSSIGLKNDGAFPVAVTEAGPWFYVHSFFLYILVIASVVVLLMQLRGVSLRFRLQILTMVAGLLVPVVGSILYLTGLSPYGIDLGPISMSISFIFHGAALISFQMFNVAPIAREKVFESMTEGVVVLNHKNAVVDYNPSMLKIIPQLSALSIGQSISDVLKGNQELLGIINQVRECDYELRFEGNSVNYHIRFTPVKTKQQESIGLIVSFIDVSERVYMHEKLQQLASIDGLTQVFNRTYFLEEMARILKELGFVKGQISLIMFDIDHFKNVNDTYGHEAGDRVLTNIAALVKDSLRPTDLLGRYGGEEFVICLPNTRIEEAYQMAREILDTISSSSVRVNNFEIKVTSSFGIASALVSDELSEKQLINTLMKKADKALYKAKEQGRNQVQAS